MDLRQLQYFARIAESGSIREAAQRANIAQSAFSRHVRALEDELGVTLFERHARGIRLTPEGHRLKVRADNIFREIAETRSELTSEAASPQGTVGIGASATTSRFLYGRLAETCQQRYPQIRLNLIEGASYFLLESLDTGRIDLAVMVDPEPRSYLATEPLVTEKVFLVGPARDVAMPAGPCTMTDLAGRPMILFSRPSGSRLSLESAAAKRGVTLDVAFEATSPDVMKDFIRRGLGYGLMPYSSIVRELESGQLSAAEFSGVALTRTFIRRTDRAASPAANAVADLIRDAFRELSEEGMFGDI